MKEPTVDSNYPSRKPLMQGPTGDRILIVRQNTAFPQLAKLFAATPIPIWRDFSGLVVREWPLSR